MTDSSSIAGRTGRPTRGDGSPRSSSAALSSRVVRLLTPEPARKPKRRRGPPPFPPGTPEYREWRSFAIRYPRWRRTYWPEGAR